MESNGRASAENRRTGAAGIAQIKKICVDDINRIIGHKEFSYSDRYSVPHSRRMFNIYTAYYAGNVFKDRAMVWFGGPKKLSGALSYWKKVEEEL